MRLVMTARRQCRGVTTPYIALAALSSLLLACTAQNPAYRTPPGTSTDALANGAPRTPDARVPSADAARAGQDAPSSTPADARQVTPDAPSDVAPMKAIVLVASNPTGRYGKYVSVHTEVCPANQILGGYSGTVGTYSGAQVVSGLEAECREIVVGPGQPPAVTLAAGAKLAALGVPGTTPFAALCPPNEAVVAFEGRNGQFLDQLMIKCAPLSITGPATVSIGPWTSLPARGGTGGAAFRDACGMGQIARGHSISTATAIDGFGLICGTPMVAP
jgi:hypothetical protein